MATFLATPSSANLAAALTDETGTGLVVLGTSPALTTPVITGVTGGSSAATGILGEVLIQSRLRSAATGLTTATTANVTSTALTLTAGDWNIYASLGFLTGTATTITQLSGGISLTSATLPGSDTQNVPTAGEVRVASPFSFATPIAMTNATGIGLTFPVVSISLSGSTTFYLVTNCSFGTSTLSAFGSIMGRRIR